jgi:hypothetical protein
MLRIQAKHCRKNVSRGLEVINVVKLFGDLDSGVQLTDLAPFDTYFEQTLVNAPDASV